MLSEADNGGTESISYSVLPFRLTGLQGPGRQRQSGWSSPNSLQKSISQSYFERTKYKKSRAATEKLNSSTVI